jgi:hypothetical protein
VLFVEEGRDPDQGKRVEGRCVWGDSGLMGWLAGAALRRGMLFHGGDAADVARTRGKKVRIDHRSQGRDITFRCHAPPGCASRGTIKIDYDSRQSVLKHNSGILKQSKSAPAPSSAPPLPRPDLLTNQASSHEREHAHKLSKR